MKRVLVSGIAGLAIGALVVGLLWLTLGGSTEGGASSAPVALPASVGEYHRFGDQSVNQQAAAQGAVAQQAEWDKQTAEHLSAAYHGAPAAVATYTTANLDPLIHVLVVRAPSPDLFAPYAELNTLGAKVPEKEAKTFGDVHCIVQNDVANAPRVLATECRRSDAGLTVHIPPVSALDPHQVAAVVDEVFDALG